MTESDIFTKLVTPTSNIKAKVDSTKINVFDLKFELNTSCWLTFVYIWNSIEYHLLCICVIHHYHKCISKHIDFEVMKIKLECILKNK